jgi:copper chaperone NosL
MRVFDGRRIVNVLFCVLLTITLVAHDASGADCDVQHPLIPPNSQFHGQCPVCGMTRSMWARTWITFDESKHVSQVCSFHCLADWIVKSGEEPGNVVLTVYHRPEKAVPANEAVIVMGSAAAGTMSPVSKIAFADAPEAAVFARACGGRIVGYADALQTAKMGLAKENQMINARRLKKGKIAEPTESDRCAVCDMYPARYPLGKCQIRTKDDRTIHFCSTQCLFAFLGKQHLYIDPP